jgi:hypothetical protein
MLTIYHPIHNSFKSFLHKSSCLPLIFPIYIFLKEEKKKVIWKGHRRDQRINYIIFFKIMKADLDIINSKYKALTPIARGADLRKTAPD